MGPKSNSRRKVGRDIKKVEKHCARATTLRIATLALVHSTAECCAPVWCRRAHIRLIDPAINDALRIVTGCLRPTPADNLPTLAGMQPTELRRIGATQSLARRAMESGHLLHSALTRLSSANARRLISRHPFVQYLPHNISSVYLTTYVRRSGRIANGMRSGRTAPQDAAFSSPTPAPIPPNDPPKKSLGPAQPPPHQCRTFPLLLVQMGHGFLCGL